MSNDNSYEYVKNKLKGDLNEDIEKIITDKLSNVQNLNNNNSSVSDFNKIIEHYESCNDDNCDLHKQKVSTETKGFIRGLRKGISLGEAFGKKKIR